MRLPRSSPPPDDSDESPPPPRHLTRLRRASTPRPNPKSRQSLPVDSGYDDDEDRDLDDVLGYSDNDHNSDDAYQPSSPRRDRIQPSPTDEDIDFDAYVPPGITEGLIKIARLRASTNEWVSCLGPVEGWAQLFQDQYDNACSRSGEGSTQEGVDEFLKSVEKHVKWGRAILKELREEPAVYAPVSVVGWADCINIGDLYDTLYKGISLLEVRLDILAPRVAVSTDGDSGIRKFGSLVAHV